MSKKIRSYSLFFVPWIWTAILLINPSFFLKNGRANEDTLYALYCNYSSELVLTISILANLFSLFQIFRIPEKTKYLFLLLLVVSMPVQYILYIAAHVQVFGK